MGKLDRLDFFDQIALILSEFSIIRLYCWLVNNILNKVVPFVVGFTACCLIWRALI